MTAAIPVLIVKGSRRLRILKGEAAEILYCGGAEGKVCLRFRMPFRMFFLWYRERKFPVSGETELSKAAPLARAEVWRGHSVKVRILSTSEVSK